MPARCAPRCDLVNRRATSRGSCSRYAPRHTSLCRWPRIGASQSGVTSFAFFGLSILSMTQTTELIAAARDGASPDFAERSSNWTDHFHEPGPTPWRTVNCLPRYSM